MVAIHVRDSIIILDGSRERVKLIVQQMHLLMQVVVVLLYNIQLLL
jgi:hypothetical protein